MIAVPHGGRVLECTDNGKSLVDFSANINPWGPPAVLREAWEGLFPLVTTYPPLSADYHRKSLGSLYHIASCSILPCNGASQGIYLLARELPVKQVAVCEPLFTEYAHAFRYYGKEVTHHLHLPGHDPSTLLDTLFQVPHDAIVIGNPGNPVGDTPPQWFWEILLRRCDEKGIWLLVDEAFQEFMREETSLSALVFQWKKLVVVRSLTKYYSLAGLRGGFLVSHPELVSTIERGVEPWSVNSILTRALDILASSDLSFFHNRTAEKLAEEKAFLEEGMKKTGFLENMFPSKVNYYLANLKNEDHEFFSFLEERGILVRSCSDFYGLSSGTWFRFAVRDRRENLLLLEAANEYARKN